MQANVRCAGEIDVAREGCDPPGDLFGLGRRFPVILTA